MKFRAILLIAILLGGTYAVIQSQNEYDERLFTELTNYMNDPFISLTLNKPSNFGTPPDEWVIDDEVALESLVFFLEPYHVRKLKPDEIPSSPKTDGLSLVLETEYGNEFTIDVNSNYIILNSTSYYEIVNGPLESDWIIKFFVNNKSS
ncbi:hypothetical protein [Sporosarcina sp. FA9]|uniref:hypothetical protein n=1 Tax=Sporosarcina sp. FA9 TaxID=3413030 RepID=UPI003F65A471